MTNNLTDTQKEVLLNASKRADGNVYPLPSRLKGASINKVIKALADKGLIEKQGDTMVINNMGESALCGGKEVKVEEPFKHAKNGSKKAILLDMLKTGSTIPQMEKATGWQKHTIRGTMSNLKKQHNLEISSSKNTNGERIYLIA